MLFPINNEFPWFYLSWFAFMIYISGIQFLSECVCLCVFFLLLLITAALKSNKKIWRVIKLVGILS